MDLETYSSLLTNLPVVVYRRYSTTSIELVNNAIQSLSGYAASEFIDHQTRSFSSLISPQDREWVEGAIEQAIARQVAYSLKYRLIRADGRSVWVSDQAQPGNNGDQIWFDGVVSEISQAMSNDLASDSDQLAQAKQDNQIMAEIARQVDQRLSFHVDNTPLAVIEWDAEFRVQRWSSQAEQMFGWSAAEVIGKRFSDWTFVYEADLDAVNQVASALISSGRNTSQNRNYAKDGSVVYCEWHNSVLLDAAGQVLSILSLILDVSDRKRAEQERQEIEIALRRSQSQYQTICQLTTEYIYSCYVTPEGELIDEWTSGSLERLTSYTEAELPADKWLDVVHRDERPAVSALIQRAIATIEPAALEYQIVTKDQELRWVCDRIQPEWDATEQRVVRLLGSLENITERKQTELSLQESEARFRSIFEESPVGINLVDLEGKVLKVNPSLCQMLGYTPTELSQMSLVELTHPQDWQREATYMQQVLQGEISSYQIEKRLLPKTGKPLWVNLSTAMIRDAENTILYGLGIVEDISQRKQAEAALQLQAEREQVLGEITLRVRKSLKLEDILNTTVEEIRRSFQADRVLIAYCASQGNNKVVAESVSPGWPAFMGVSIQEPWFWERLDFYRQGHYEIVHDLTSQALSGDLHAWMERWQIKSRLAVPILSENQFWGIIAIHQSSVIRDWRSYEITLLEQLANQVAIAIQQARLYRKLQAANQELAQLAYLDGLTQLANRRRFDEYLEQEWRRMQREQVPLTLVLCDIDFFKSYNDNFGHLAGDQCLQKVAQVLRQSALRPADLVARYGGEEFALVLPNTREEGAIKVIRTIQSHMQTLQVSQSDRLVTLSFGITTAIPNQKSSPETLIKTADIALYRAKCQGRDCFVVLRGSVPERQ
ncbi:MAG: PAS domain S-box protein [Aphanocapsa sp. GSE-SYN-MK-11-07L]|jgi:diguanylate cyclase (GGDEF)-like protein/PAS domain S-box-containing protein|nr:PAS domain S-box protein [Aphanocapsa sp. GSE-SYN-MK-11-07L]